MTEATQAPYVSRGLDIVGAEAVRDPHGYFGALRNESPIIWDERSRSWVITSHALVTLALRDDRRFSSDRIRPFIARKLSSPDTDPGVRQAFEVLADWLVFNDKPLHLRLRKLINQAFMSAAMTRLTERFQALFDAVIDTLPESGAVEEFLRYDGSGKAVTRVLREDTDVLGVPMKAGQRAFLILAAANRDPAIFPDPDSLRLDRQSERGHLAFGYGLHSCMGLQLARLEASIAIPGILRKWRHIELAGAPRWHPQLLSRGLFELTCTVQA